MPVWVSTFGRILGFEKRRAVEQRQAVFVVGEVRRNPVQEYSDTVLMQAVDEKHCILRRAVSAGWGKVTSRLIPPRTIEGMFGERKELDMSEAKPLRIRGEFWSELAIREKAITFLGDAHP